MPGENQPSPLDGKSGTGAERESTPREPERAEQARESDGNPPSDPGGATPHSPRESTAPAANVAAQPPPGSATARANAPDANDRWGDLPVYARDVFRAQGGAAFPPHYRDWIDTYHRRLNRQP